MSYGFQAFTGLGESKLVGHSSFTRVVFWKLLKDGSNSSATVPEFREDRGSISACPLGGGSGHTIYDITWDEGSKTVSWDLTDDNNTNDIILIMVTHG